MIPAIIRPVTKKLWTPKDLSNLSLWLDASDTSTISLSGSNVVQWNDKSNQQNHFIQATASLQPTYANNEVSFVNGRLLKRTSQSGMLAANGEHSLFIVMEMPQSTLSTASFINIFQNSSTAAGSAARRPQFFLRNSGNNGSFAYGSASSNPISPTVGSRHILGHFYNASTGQQEPYLNGTALTASTVTAEASTSPLEVYLGDNSNQNVIIKVRQVYFLPYRLSTTDRQKLEGYLAFREILQSSLPSNHPFRNSPPKK